MAKSATALPLLGICLDRLSPNPLYLQLYEQIRQAIITGQLPAGRRLPSTRELAASLEVSRNTVTAAFEQLLAEGYLESKVGAGDRVSYQKSSPGSPAQGKSVAQTSVNSSPNHIQFHHSNSIFNHSSFVSPHAHLSAQALSMMALPEQALWHSPEPPRAFHPHLPALDAFPRDLWCRLMGKQGRSPSSHLLNYGDPCGYAPLRQQIAEYLKTTRSVHCEPEQVIVVSGSQQALYLTAKLLLNPGDAVWMEDPGCFNARYILQQSGATLIPVPVDQQGLNIELAQQKNPEARLAYITPSHQFPMGYSLSLERRQSLLQWAAQSGAWIIEQDSDSAYRYTGQSLPALQGCDPQRVIYMGSFSKVLFPALRLGYVVVPAELVEVFAIARTLIDRHSPPLEQATLADFMAAGYFTRHLRRMKVLYAERQAALMAATQSLADVMTVERSPAGTHLIAWLQPHIDDRTVSLQAAQRGIIAHPLSAYRLQPPPSDAPSALLLGYAAIPTAEMQRAVQDLGDVIRTVQPTKRQPSESSYSRFSSSWLPTAS
ncbi:MAG: PLP-dependent aminotransferase family protein [Oculatellaceae cyanobacterium Prado106]|nr:PLP-dependent aminotransferase family protein [Oculatellaceae cyanobacterium Prado106]